VTFIAPRQKVLRHLGRLAAWQAGEKPAPITIEWDLSNRCSLGCQDCHFAHTHTKGPWAVKPRLLPMAFEGTGDLADVGLVQLSIQDMASAGVCSVVWSGGGEPTLHPEWERIVATAWGAGLQQGMYTHGGHISKAGAAVLAKCASWVVVSLDAADAETYAAEKGVPAARFEAACAGIRWLAQAGATVGASFLLHEDNWHRAWDMVELAHTLGATYTTFRPAVRWRSDKPSVTDDKRHWVTLATPLLNRLSTRPEVEIDVARFEQYRDWNGHGYETCYGVRVNAVVTPDGRMWVCCNRRGMPGSCLGDLRTESFGAIWARHPASFKVDDQCRVMCRLHPVNQVLHALEQPRAHEAFV
jgi:MoaA/NifB/PqqE/SkfB family radical SAM enzyme